MPAKRKPGYLLHKPTGQARVRISGRDHYLGEYGSPESRDRYDQLIAQWFRNNDVDRHTVCVDELCLRYLEHAKSYYRKNGRQTSEVDCLRSALRPLVHLAGCVRVADFGPLKLASYRDHLIASGYAISTIRKHVGRVRTMFKWAAAREMIPATVHAALLTLESLQAGRIGKRDAENTIRQTGCDSSFRYRGKADSS